MKAMFTHFQTANQSISEREQTSIAKETAWRYKVLGSKLITDPANPGQHTVEAGILTDELIAVINTTSPQKALQKVDTLFSKTPPPDFNGANYLPYTNSLTDLTDRGMATAIHGCHLARSIPETKRQMSTKLSLAIHFAPPNTVTKGYIEHRLSTDDDMTQFLVKETDEASSSRKELPHYGQRHTINDIRITAGNIQLFLHCAYKDYPSSTDKPIIHEVLETILAPLKDPTISRWAKNMEHKYRHFAFDLILQAEACCQQLYHWANELPTGKLPTPESLIQIRSFAKELANRTRNHALAQKPPMGIEYAPPLYTELYPPKKTRETADEKQQKKRGSPDTESSPPPARTPRAPGSSGGSGRTTGQTNDQGNRGNGGTGTANPPPTGNQQRIKSKAYAIKPDTPETPIPTGGLRGTNDSINGKYLCMNFLRNGCTPNCERFHANQPNSISNDIMNRINAKINTHNWSLKPITNTGTQG